MQFVFKENAWLGENSFLAIINAYATVKKAHGKYKNHIGKDTLTNKEKIFIVRFVKVLQKSHNIKNIVKEKNTEMFSKLENQRVLHEKNWMKTNILG